MPELDVALRIADVLVELDQRDDVQVVFKASFDKANRTSASAERGPGADEGLKRLAKIALNTTCTSSRWSNSTNTSA
ncbi:MAG: hypothetical protein AAF989_06370, partial [Planctomycetota bacterium]